MLTGTLINLVYIENSKYIAKHDNDTPLMLVAVTIYSCTAMLGSLLKIKFANKYLQFFQRASCIKNMLKKKYI